MSGTVTQISGKWYCSITYEIEVLDEIIEPTLENTIGIDLGIKTLATTSDGQIIENPKFLRKSQRKLKKLQRQLRKCEDGSKNLRKKRLKISRLHRKIRNQRVDYIHKFTSDLVNNYDVICLEDLNVKGMVKLHSLAKSLSDASFYEIKRQLEYKCSWSNKYFIQIGRFDASTKTCSSCGYIKPMPLFLRTYNCPSCSLELDRDLNASINIRNWSYEKLISKVGQGMTEPSEPNGSFNACGDTSTGESRLSGSRHVSLKQESHSLREFHKLKFFECQ